MKMDDPSSTYSSQLPIVMNYPKIDLYAANASNRKLDWITTENDTNKFIKVSPKLPISKLITKS